MVKANFEVGKREKHIILVEVSSFWLRKLKVTVDGREVVNTLWSKRSGGSANFSVGEKERHQVEVRVNGYFVPKITLLVDGKIEGSI